MSTTGGGSLNGLMTRSANDAGPLDEKGAVGWGKGFGAGWNGWGGDVTGTAGGVLITGGTE